MILAVANGAGGQPAPFSPEEKSERQRRKKMEGDVGSVIRFPEAT